MAVDFWTIDRTKPGATQPIRLAQLIREAKQLAASLKATMAHQNDGSDYSAVETHYGIATGQGDDVTNLVGTIDTILNTATDMAGADRLAFLNQMVDRMAMQ